jgi:hypothetical protein
VEINIIATTDSDLDSIRSTIINLVNMYFGSRSVGQSFIKNDLIGVINSNVTVNSLTIPYPLLNIVPTASNKKIKLNNINISLSK